MIISVEDLKKYITTTEQDAVLEAKLQALEILIRKYTNNNFQLRNARCTASAYEGELVMLCPYINEGDTIQISESLLNDGIYTYQAEGMNLYEEASFLVTKVVYPIDVVMGVVNMLKWDIDNRDKVGIQSETISRHAVTYFNMDGDNSMLGYPKSLIGFLKPYMKARF